MTFPVTRMRRLRGTPALRRLVRETHVSPDHFVYPLFVVPGSDIRRPIETMPGMFHFSVDRLVQEARSVWELGIPSILLFGLPESKDAQGSGAYAADGVVQRAVRAVKDACPDLCIMTDICLCEYTDHGHCGVVSGGGVDNDSTLELLARTAVSHAQAGAEVVAPSDMMDGRVSRLRSALDDTGFEHTAVMSYAAKYASSFYGPFREAAQSAPRFGDRRSYQMDPSNAREALREVALDIEEGADIVMVKPALAYLDIIRRVRRRFDIPVAAYNVSGEYSMILAAAHRGWVDGDLVMMETLTAIKRAGADIVITYFAKRAAGLLG